MDYPIAFRYILLGDVEVHGAFNFCIQIVNDFYWKPFNEYPNGSSISANQILLDVRTNTCESATKKTQSKRRWNMRTQHSPHVNDIFVVALASWNVTPGKLGKTETFLKFCTDAFGHHRATDSKEYPPFSVDWSWSERCVLVERSIQMR